MHLRRDAPAAKRSGWVSEANCEAAARPRAVRFPDEHREELCEAKSQEGARSPTRSSRSSRRESCPPRRRSASTRSPSSPTRESWTTSPPAEARPRTRFLRPPPKVDAPVALSPMPAAAAGATATRMRTAAGAIPARTRNSERRSRRSSERRDRLFRLRRPRGGRESRPYPIVRQYAVIAVGISSGKIIIYFRAPSGYPRRITASCVPEKQSGGWSAANNRKGKRKCQKQTE